VWTRRQEARLAVVERTVERAKALRRRLDQGAVDNADKRIDHLPVKPTLINAVSLLFELKE
jgi:hypothetical protein